MPTIGWYLPFVVSSIYNVWYFFSLFYQSLPLRLRMSFKNELSMDLFLMLTCFFLEYYKSFHIPFTSIKNSSFASSVSPLSSRV